MSDHDSYITKLEAIIAQQTEQIAFLEQKVVFLMEEMAKLKVRKDSHNSSLAPSSDLSKKTKSLRTKSNRQSGGQAGHQGNTLKMTSTPDEIIELRSSFCSVCGADLAAASFVLQAKRQVIEIPPILPIYKEYQQFSCSCSACSHRQIAYFPAQVTAPIQYGSSVASLVSYFSVYQSLPYNRLQKMFKQVFSLPLSEGTIENILNKVALKCQIVYEQIKTEISQSEVLGADETGLKVSGEKWWFWVWQTALNTFMVASDNRGFKTVEAFFAQGFPNATIISDRWAAQLKTFSKNKQICLAHLLRELNYLIETEKTEFATEFKTLIGTVYALKKEQKSTQKPCEKDDKNAILIEKKLTELLEKAIDDKKCPKTAIFHSSMIKYRHYLLTCLYQLEVPPDNNASERAIRILKVKQKIAGQFKTGQHTFCVIRSVIDTLIKRKIDIIPNIQNIFNLQPE